MMQLKHLTKQLKLTHKNSDAWYNKGRALYELSRPDEAIKAYDKAIEINPQVMHWLGSIKEYVSDRIKQILMKQ